MDRIGKRRQEIEKESDREGGQGEGSIESEVYGRLSNLIRVVREIAKSGIGNVV